MIYIEYEIEFSGIQFKTVKVGCLTANPENYDVRLTSLCVLLLQQFLGSANTNI